MTNLAVEGPSLGEGRDLSPAEPLAMLGRANASREWPCGGIERD
jgi:hypothetical protein